MVFSLLDQPTTLVLGAGASVPFGLPTAGELKQLIINEARVPEPPPRSMNAQAFRNRALTDLSRLKERLHLSHRTSIDAFLADNAELADIGKLAIAQTLLPREAAAVPRLASDWYRWLMSQLRVRKSDVAIDFGKLSIITFNYDRTLEMGLAQMLASITRLSLAEAWDLRAGWPITHVYGELSGAVDPHPSSFRLVVGTTNSDVWACKESIRVVGEDRASPTFASHRESIRQTIHASSHVFFLGFGFDPENVELLGIGRAFSEWRRVAGWVRGTAYGLSTQRQLQTHRLLDRPGVLDPDRKCLDFLDEHVPLSG